MRGKNRSNCEQLSAAEISHGGLSDAPSLGKRSEKPGGGGGGVVVERGAAAALAQPQTESK